MLGDLLTWLVNQMASNKFLEELSDYQKDLSRRIFNLVIGRVMKIAYVGFDEKTKKDMDAIFLSGSDEEKEKFIKKHIPNFKKLFEEETKKIEEEIKSEIEKQI